MARSLVVAIRERDWRRLLRFPFQAPVDLFLFVGGQIVGRIQRACGLQAEGRPLTPGERRIAATLGSTRLDLDAIRVVEGPCGLLGLPGRAFVLGNTIFFPARWLRREEDREATLVHELVHVWQFQTRGLRYLSEALWAQWLGAGYDYRPGILGGTPWARLNPEQQAQLVEDAWRRGVWDEARGASDRVARAVREARDELA